MIEYLYLLKKLYNIHKILNTILINYAYKFLLLNFLIQFKLKILGLGLN